MAGTFTQIAMHFVFSTKQRAPLITPGLQEELYKYIGGIVHNEKSLMVQIGGMPDHLHLLCLLHPMSSTSEIMRLVKANSSKWINEQAGRTTRFEWQNGYGAFSVSKSILPAVSEYIRNQEEHHRKKSFQEEFLEFLKKHEIDYDPRYIWD